MKNIKYNIKVKGIDIPENIKCKCYKCWQFNNVICDVKNIEIDKRRKMVKMCKPK